MPEKLRESIFNQLFETAEIAKFSQDEYRNYEDSLKYYRDMKNSLDTSKEEGRKEGRLETAIEIATEMIKANETIDKIKRYSKLTEEQILAIKFRVDKE